MAVALPQGTRLGLGALKRTCNPIGTHWSASTVHHGRFCLLTLCESVPLLLKLQLAKLEADFYECKILEQDI